jgi:hypothetical protein
MGVRWAAHTARIGEMRNVTFYFENLRVKGHSGDLVIDGKRINRYY